MLLDVQMPGMDGFETAAHVKQRERTRDIPILFLTAIDGEAHQAFRGYAAGAVDYLSKPFDPWVLKAKVGVFVELYERRRELAAQADELRRQLARVRRRRARRARQRRADGARRARRARRRAPRRSWPRRSPRRPTAPQALQRALAARRADRGA